MDVAEICAGYNHSLALTRGSNGKPSKAYSWGYWGKAILGRPCNSSTSLVALPVAFNQEFKPANNTFIRENLKDDTVDDVDGGGQLQIKEKKAVVGPYLYGFYQDVVTQVCCGSNTTIALTAAGTVHVLGDNTFAQHGCEMDAMGDNQEEDKYSRKKSDFGKYQRPTQVDFKPPTAGISSISRKPT